MQIGRVRFPAIVGMIGKQTKRLKNRDNKTMKNTRLRITGWMLAVLLTSLPAAHAQTTDTWDGGGGDNLWGTGGNWVDNSAPGLGSIISFSGSTRLTPDWNYGDYNNMNQLLFANGAGSFVLGSTLSRNLKLQANGSTIKIENNSANLQTIASTIPTIVFDNTGEINPTSGDLTINSSIVMDNGGQLRVYGNNGNTLTLNGSVSAGSGAGHSFAINQNSVVQLNGVMNLSGGNYINAGELLLGSGGSVAGNIYIGDTSGSANATLLADSGTRANNITVRSGSSGTATLGQTGVGNVIYTGSVTLQKGATLRADVDRNAEFTGAFSGNQALTIDGAGGKIILSGSGHNDFSSVTINAGFVDLNKTAGINAIDSDITMNGGSLTLKDNNQIADTASVTIHSGTFAVDGNQETISRLNTGVDTSVTLGRGLFTLSGTGDSTLDGAITGSARYFDEEEGVTILGGRIRNLGTGKITVNGSNTGMLGDWYAYNGTISYNDNNAAGSGLIYLGNTSGSDDAKIDIGTSDVNLANSITVRSTGGTKTIENATSGGSRAVTFSGNISLLGYVNVDSSTDETITLGGVASGTGGMVKRGFGNTIMTKANTFSGGMFIDEGTLTIGSGGDLTAVTTIDLGSTLHNAGAGGAEFALASGAGAIDRNIAVKSGTGSRTISSAANNTISGNITLDKAVTVDSSAGTLTLSGGINLSNSGNNTMTVQGNGNVTMSSTISAASGASKISKTGSGSLTISGNNTSEYMLDISAGTVNLNSANALGAGYSDKVNFYGTSVMNVNANVGPANLGLTVADGATATLNVAGGNTFSVATLTSMDSAGAFTKTGAGTMKLNGNSSDFDGDLTLSAGTLMGVATVGGDFIQTGGTFAPGNSPGTFTVLGNATWTSGTYLWETTTLPSGTAGTDWDLVDISGSLTIGAGYTVNIDDLNALPGWDPTPPATYSWLIAEADGGITGFDNLGLNIAGWDVNATDPAYGFSLRQSGNQIYLDYGETDEEPPDPDPGSAVPEPNTLSFSMLAGLVIFSLRAFVKRAAKEASATPATPAV